MNRAATVLVLILTVSIGCDDGTGVAQLSADDLKGTWKFILDDGEGRCTPDYNQPYPLFLFPPDNLTELQSGGVNIVGQWSRARDREREWPATGNMNVKTGVVELHFWWTGGINGPQIRLSGTLDAGPIVSGSWSETAGSIHYSGGCTGWFEATKM